MNRPTRLTPGSIQAYTTGFVLSVALTLIAYYAVTHSILSNGMVPLLIGLALVQLLVQLIFFLHLGNESRPRWNLTIFLFSFLVVAILVTGSLWIMYHLNYNMLTGSKADAFIIHDEGVHP